MILVFQPGLRADKSKTARKFYLSLTADLIPERRLTKQEFINSLEPDSDLRLLAQDTNFETISKQGERILITFPKDQPVQIVTVDDDITGPTKTLSPAPPDPDDDLIGTRKPRKPAQHKDGVAGLIGWFETKGQRVEGPIMKEIMSHGKPYYGILFEGKIRFKLKSDVNIL